jgi:MFS transporter, putative metabolite:H+ symporter
VRKLVSDRFTPYQRRLFVFLSVAQFFEGYDFIALTQILPNLRKSMALGPEWSGYLVTVINIGTVIAYLLVRGADRWGRRRVLTVTIAGYTLFTFLTALSPNVYAFAMLQLCARVFLIGEWATCMVIAAEEFPAARRGMAIGFVSAMGSLGSIACVVVTPLLLKTDYGWRAVYFVGIVPLLILAFARRNLKETRRFTEQAKNTGRRPLTHIFSTPYRRRVLELALIWFVTYICTQNAVTFWKEFAVAERGFTDAMVGTAIGIAAVVSLPLVFMAGKLLDVIGRRRGAVLIFGAGAVGTLGCYTLHGMAPLTIALIFGIFSSSAVLPVLNAFMTELFPTDLRGDAFAWSNNLLGRVSYVGSPVIVGLMAKDIGWGPAVRWTAAAPIVALILILVLLPETKARELEETAAV